MTTTHGPGSLASNSTADLTCTVCGIDFIGETYTDPDTGHVTNQCTNGSGQSVCDDCA